VKRVLLATSEPKLNEAIKKNVNNFGIEIIGIADNELVFQSCLKQNIPDIILISKRFEFNNLSVVDYIIRLHNNLPNIRIIYLAGQLNDFDVIKQKELMKLIESGIYDIYTEKVISMPLIKQMLAFSKKYEDVAHLNQIKGELPDYQEFDEIEIEDDNPDDEIIDIDIDFNKVYDNVIVVSSIKPGTGKTFISSNLAMALSKNGTRKPNQERPKIAYIEADLQNLSVGTILALKNQKNYLKEVLTAIGSLFDENNKIHVTLNKKKQVDDLILNSFQQYMSVKDLYSLAGSHFLPQEILKIKDVYYNYLIDVVSQNFDIVIIDTNSSLTNTTSLPLLNLCKYAFFIINLDYNNIKNNGRYQKYLTEIGLRDKIFYILNEDIQLENRSLLGIPTFEDLICDSELLEKTGLKLLGKIPAIPKEIFFNRLYDGRPIILDNTEFTLKTRLEISKIANNIWPLDNLEWLQNEYEQFKLRKLGGDLNKNKPPLQLEQEKIEEQKQEIKEDGKKKRKFFSHSKK